MPRICPLLQEGKAPVAADIREFVVDSPLEGEGFELSVPRQKDNVFEAPQLDSAILGEAIAHQMATA